MRSLPLLPTTLVGSYPQPDWLIDRGLLGASTPPRVRMRELWRVAPEFLEQAQDDATLIAIHDQERAGIDIVSDGEMRRESYFNRFATALEGIDLDNPGTVTSRTGKQVPVPRVVGRVRRLRPVNVRDVQFLRASTDRLIKITVPGPFTMTQLAQNDAYASNAELALDYAAAVNEEIKDLFAAGAMSCRSTSRTCRRTRPRRANSALPRSNGRWTAWTAPRPCTSASDTDRWSRESRRATTSCLSSQPRR